MRYQKIFRIGRLCAVGITLFQSIAGTAHAAEILTAEVVATPNDVTVEQGGSANFAIQVSASGQNQCGSTSTAKVMTTFSISAGGTLSSNNLSSALNFSAPGSGGNCAVTWTGAPTIPYSVTASVAAAATTPIGNYNIVLSTAQGTTQVTNSNTSGGRLGDGAATTIVVHVVAPADSTPPVIVPTLSPAAPNGLNSWYVSNVSLNWSVTDAQSAVTSQTGCSTTNITADQLATTYTCQATSAGGTSSASVTIKRDATNPTIGAALAPSSPAGSGWYNIVTGAPAVSFTCGDASPGSGLASTCPASHLFGQGSAQSFSASIADLAGNSNSANVSGISVDTIAPTIDVHADVIAEATSTSGALVAYSNPAAHDSGSGVGATTCSPASGSQFPLGNTTVTCSATDVAGNPSSSTFKVTVHDTTAPAISQPSDVTVEAMTASGAVVSYNTPTATDAVDGTDSVSCTPASGTTFGLGPNTITCTSTDQAGNQGSTTFIIIVQDTTAPILSLPNNIVAEATSAAGATVSFNATASDAVNGDVTPTCAPASGSTFAIQETTVNCSAADQASNSSSGSFKVNVRDTTASVIDAHLDVNAEATSNAGAVVNYTSPATSDVVDGAGTATCSPASGSTFGLGNIAVTCNATDAHGNNATATSFVVHVVDTTPPVIAAHGDESTEATSSDGAVVNYTSPSTSDAVDGAGTATCLPAAGLFAVGATTVTCNASDAHNNPATATTFVVHVVDTTPPALTLPVNQTAEAAVPGGAIVNFAATASDIVDGGVSVTCTPANGALFPLGTTTVNCSATDAHHNTSSGHFDVTVVDTTAPVLSLPADITAEATGPTGAVVNYSASALDLVDGPVAINCAPVSGSTFVLGTTVITCSAEDSHHNVAPGGFEITVRDTTAPVIALHADETAQATGPTGAAVSYSSPATSDVVDGAGTATCSPVSGSTFALGNTTVTCNATDAAGNPAVATMFVVHVVDTHAPVIASHADETAQATGPTGAAVSYTSPSTSDAVDGAGTATCSPASGSTFALGNPTVTCNATDAAGNHALATTFVVHVVDTTAPVIAAHGDETVQATSPAGAAVSYSSPTTSDAVDGAGTATCSSASGSPFALGNTTVTCNATDAAGNHAIATTFVVHVVDTTAPVIASHIDVTAEASGSTGAAVSYSSPATSDAVDGAGTATCAPASGSPFTLGNTTVTCNATDGASNHAAPTTFVVHVVDTTAPVIASHADVATEATGPTGAAVSYSSPATSDVVDGAGTATCSPVSGSTFALGDTTVTCNATDAAGNPAVATTFAVHVVDTHAPAVTCGSADSLWHATNVSIACTASDGGSGLANAGDASFSLSTSVAAGTETANASTGSRNVCDVSGNCSTAGPIAGNKIDKKGPIGITFVGGPAAGGVYYFGSVPAAPTCTATDGGSGLLSCVVTGYSNAIGAQTLTATAKDNVLNSSTATLNFTVNSWSILGFYQPTDMGNVWNTVKNGSTVPLKFEVFAGSTELTNATLGVVVTSLTYKAATCSTAPVDDIELIATGNTTLRYDTTAGQYIYNWKTPSTPNACYVVTVTTVDGSKISANFKLK